MSSADEHPSDLAEADPADAASPEPTVPDGAPPGAADPPQPGSGEPPTVEALLDDLDRVTAERDGHLNDLQRVSADFANFRKRVDQRRSDELAQAATRLVEKILPVLDACDAALLQGAVDVDPIKAALVETLTREGLEPIDALGDPFDPNRHEAVQTEDGDGDMVVAEILRTGYVWNGRVLRPAMVKVRG